ncbi:MAG: DUF4387 domain-containing protein [Proteobacteria bacterium]|nr:DUF4387 domain-containing protein [Pseudomonadota bacterium]
MAKLYELASLVRSKNAGPFALTFDILFNRQEDFERVKRSGAVSGQAVARLYGVSANEVRFFVCDNARAFKASIRRPTFQGDIGDCDNHGGQQFAPLLDIDIP